jgi:hypothetical protein
LSRASTEERGKRAREKRRKKKKERETIVKMKGKKKD